MLEFDEVLEKVVEESDIKDAREFFISNEGTMFLNEDVEYSNVILKELSDSFISPVQKIETVDGFYYGVIEYVEGDEWYGFKTFDDRGLCRRVIGVQEGDDMEYESDLPHVSAGDKSGSFAKQYDATYEDLLVKLDKYYDEKIGPDRDKPDKPKIPYANNRGRQLAKGRSKDKNTGNKNNPGREPNK